MKFSRALIFRSLSTFCIACGDPAALDSGSSTLQSSSAALTAVDRFIEETVVTGLVDPTAMAVAPDGRIFITERAGKIRIVQDGQLLAAPFYAMTVNTSGERGLLGITLDPNFSTNGFVYVFHTAVMSSSLQVTVQNRVSRLRATGNVGAGETMLFGTEAMTAQTTRLGGGIAFGADGKLYFGHGEGGIPSNSQTLTTVLGKLMRINADGTLPTDNPFYTTTVGRVRAVYATGLRSPVSIALEKSSGRMFVHDPGQTSFDEINVGAAKANYGYPANEGSTTSTTFKSPLHAYPHVAGCNLSGGAFYDSATAAYPPEYAGKYFYADSCGTVSAYDPASGVVTTFATDLASPGAVGVGLDGLVYVVARGTGTLLRYRHISGLPPVITTAPESVTVPWGGSAQFGCDATGTDPLAFQWQRDGLDIPGATGRSLSVQGFTLDDGARFRCVVTNDFDTAQSADALLVVLPNNAPVVAVASPTSGSTYQAGSTFTFSASATDVEDGTLPASAFHWTFVLVPFTGAVPLITEIIGQSSGEYTVPTTAGLRPNGTLSLRVRVEDAGHLADTTSVELQPHLATLVLQTTPSGLSLEIDGYRVETPVTLTTVVGTTHALTAPAAQTMDGVDYVYAGWSEGQTPSCQVVVGPNGTQVQALYRAVLSGTGLSGEYFNKSHLSQRRVIRLDPVVDFAWGKKEPMKGVSAETFSVRWTGFLQAPTSESYTLTTQSDDGVRLWVDDRLLIDQWNRHSVRTHSAVVTLIAGRKHKVRMEYYDHKRHAVARLMWSTATTPQQVIPALSLHPNPHVLAILARCDPSRHLWSCKAIRD